MLGRREVFRRLLRFTARRRLRSRLGIAAPQLLADLLHGVGRSCRGGCRFAAGLAAGWIKRQPLLERGAKIGRDLHKTHAAALAVVFEPLHFSDALHPLVSIEGERERHEPVRTKGADRAKTKSVLGNAQKHSAVAGAELQVHQLIRLFAGERFLRDFHAEALAILTLNHCSFVAKRGTRVSMYGRPFACIFCARPDRLAGQPVQESTSICNKPLVLEVYPGNKAETGDRHSGCRHPLLKPVGLGARMRLQIGFTLATVFLALFTAALWKERSQKEGRR